MAQSEHRDDRGRQPEREPSPGRRRRRKRPSIAGKVLLGLLFILVAALGLSVFALQMANDVFGFSKPDRSIEVSIERGMSTTEIAALLAQEGVIEQAVTFRVYSGFRNRDGVFQAGDYVLNSRMSYDQIIQALRTGNTIKEEVRITFIEGMTVREIAALLEEKEVCDAREFMAALEDDYGFDFENMLPDKERFRRLEGYLFPDTYDFYVGERVDSVVRKFLRNFQSRVFPGLYEDILEAGMTMDDAVVLASIIQKEAGNVDDMRLVSSVFHNRLGNAAAGLPRLQSDVTIFYVEQNIKPYQSRATQPLYDAYNTYVCTGLPAGPICSPGIDAIRAAIDPETSGYYYFVADVNGKCYYSETLQEHNANIRKAHAAGGAEHGTNIS